MVLLSLLADAPVRAWVLAHQTAAWISVDKTISRFGAWPWLMAGSVLCLGVCAVRKNRAAMQLIVIAMVCSSLAGLIADTTRALTGRTRPNSGLADGWFGVRSEGRWLVGDARYHAFPSGHSTAAMGLVAPFLIARRRAGWALLLLPSVISAARIGLGAHHFSDVLAGTALGYTVAALAMEKLRPISISMRFFREPSKA